MSQSDPANVVIASVVIITASTMLRRVREDKLPFHAMETIVFGFMLLISLLVLAIVAPSIAKTLAYLGIVGAFALNGPAVFTVLGNFGRVKGVV